MAEVTKGLPGRDFSSVLANPSKAPLDAVRPGVLFNYVGLSSVDARFFTSIFQIGFGKDGAFAITPSGLATNHPDLFKRGFLSMAYDGRYKFARYYAPAKFNTPTTLEQILRDNDIELFDLKNDPDERKNLAVEPEKHKAAILRMNALLNDLISREVGDNDGSFLPKPVRPKPAS